MLKRSDDDYISHPWGSSDGVCRSPYKPKVGGLPNHGLKPSPRGHCRFFEQVEIVLGDSRNEACRMRHVPGVAISTLTP